MALSKGSSIKYDDVNVLRNTCVASENILSRNNCVAQKFYIGNFYVDSVKLSDGSGNTAVTASTSGSCWYVYKDNNDNLLFEFDENGESLSSIGTIETT